MMADGLDYLLQPGGRDGVILHHEAKECPPLTVMVAKNNYGVDIVVEGYGSSGLADPQSGGPIHIQRDSNTGRLILYVWADINSDEPTHIIDLEKAALSNEEGLECDSSV